MNGTRASNLPEAKWCEIFVNKVETKHSKVALHNDQAQKYTKPTDVIRLFRNCSWHPINEEEVVKWFEDHVSIVSTCFACHVGLCRFEITSESILVVNIVKLTHKVGVLSKHEEEYLMQQAIDFFGPILEKEIVSTLDKVYGAQSSGCDLPIRTYFDHVLKTTNLRMVVHVCSDQFDNRMINNIRDDILFRDLKHINLVGIYLKIKLYVFNSYGRKTWIPIN